MHDMAIFALISPAESAALEKAVIEQFRDRYFKISAGQFMISAYNTTPQRLAEQLGTRDGGLGQVLIITVSDYFGCHSASLWQWLEAEARRLPDWMRNLNEQINATTNS